MGVIERENVTHSLFRDNNVWIQRIKWSINIVRAAGPGVIYNGREWHPALNVKCEGYKAKRFLCLNLWSQISNLLEQDWGKSWVMLVCDLNSTTRVWCTHFFNMTPAKVSIPFWPLHSKGLTTPLGAVNTELRIKNIFQCRVVAGLLFLVMMPLSFTLMQECIIALISQISNPVTNNRLSLVIKGVQKAEKPMFLSNLLSVISRCAHRFGLIYKSLNLHTAQG